MSRVSPSGRLGYQEIADDLRSKIAAGDWREGDQLPSEAELVERYSVSRGTARSAIRDLVSRGEAVTDHGRGTFVRKKPTVHRVGWLRFHRRREGLAGFAADADATRLEADVDVISIERRNDPPEFVVEELGLTPGEAVLFRHRRYLLDGEPVQIATSFVRWQLAEGTPMVETDTGPGGIYARLEDKGFELDHFDEFVTARMPTSDEEQSLSLPPGVPVIRVVRIAIDANGTPLEVCDTIMDSDRYELSYRVAASG